MKTTEFAHWPAIAVDQANDVFLVWDTEATKADGSPAPNKVMLIDLDKAVPKTREFMYDSVHLNEAGSRFVAGIVARELSMGIAGYTLR